MAEYIEREALTELVDRMKYYAHEYCTGGNLGREIEGTDEVLFDAVDAIERLTADAVERKRGEWEFLGDGYYNCTNCGHIFDARPAPHFFPASNPFCRKCGADMRVGKAEKLESHSKEDGE